MTDARGYYERLGVASTASAADIRRAFLAKAKLLHPDTGALEDSTEFQELSDAYRTLSNPRRRERYDIEGDRLRWDARAIAWLARADHPTPPRLMQMSWGSLIGGVLIVVLVAISGLAYLTQLGWDEHPAGMAYHSAEPSGPPPLSHADAEADAAAAATLAVPLDLQPPHVHNLVP